MRVLLFVLSVAMAMFTGCMVGWQQGELRGFQQGMDAFECVDVTDPDQWVWR